MLDSDEARIAHYKKLATEFPRSHVIGRMPLLITSGEENSIWGIPLIYCFLLLLLLLLLPR